MGTNNEIIEREASTTDEALANLACRDPLWFKELYQRYQPRIYAYCLSRSGHPQDAQDLTSQVFLAALEGLARYNPQRSFGAGLFGIARHKLVDRLRRQTPELPLESAENFADGQVSVEEHFEQKLRWAAVAQALRSLPAEQAEALTLRLFGGLSTAQSAQVMGKSEAAIKMLVLRGLRSLQNRLALDDATTQEVAQ